MLETQKNLRKSAFLGNLPLPLIQRFGMNWRRDRSIRAGRRPANMFSNEVIAMAVKKSTAPKSGTKTAKAKPAVKKAAPQKAAPKKAPGVKLTEPQKKFLETVAAKKEEGLVSTKGTAKILGTLLEKKLVKKGKKEEGGHFRFHITKLGSKHSPAPGSSTTSSEPSSAPST